MHVCRETGIVNGLNVDVLQFAVTDNDNCIVLFLNSDTHFAELACDGLDVLGDNRRDAHASARGGNGYHIGARLDHIGNDGIATTMQFLNSANLNYRRTGAYNICSASVEEVCQVDDMRLARGILDNRCSLCKNRCQNNVDGSPYGCNVEINAIAFETFVGFGIDKATLGIGFGAKRTEALHVLVEGTASAKITAAGPSNACLAKATKLGAE